VAADGEGLFGCACWLEGYACWRSLPGRRGAGRIGRIFRNNLAVQGLLQNRLASIDLCDYGIDFLAVFRDAAIGGIIAVPTGGGVDGVELGKIDWGNVAGDAVDEKSSATLP